VHLNLLCISSSSYRLLTHTTLALCANIYCAWFRYYAPTFHMNFHPMHTPCKFHIFLRAQISAHSTEYTVVKQLILILMCVPTKLLCVKKNLCIPCAPYYGCTFHARLISMCASTHNNISRCATIYRAYWHATVSRVVPNLPRVPVRQPFPRTLYDSNFGHLKVTFL
jgi:hypothetical protein